MAGAGPGGKVIGRLSVRVLPDTSDFRRTLKQELAGINETLEIPVDLNADNLRSEVSRACRAAEVGQKISVPMDIDRSALDKADRVLKPKPIEIPVRPNVDNREWQRERFLNTDRPFEVDVKPKLNPPTLPLEVTPDWKGGDPWERKDRPPVDIDLRPNLDPKTYTDIDLEPVQVDLLPKFDPKNRDWAPHIDGIEIPVTYDQSGLDESMKKARKRALDILQKGQLLLKLDADDDVFRRKLTAARKELEQLKNFGTDILRDEQMLPVLRQIEKINRALTDLDNKKSTPAVQLRKGRLLDELDSLNRQLDNLDKKDYSFEVRSRIEDATANVRKLEQDIAKLTARRQTIEIDVDRDSIGRSLAVLRGDYEAFGRTIDKDVGDSARRTRTRLLDMNEGARDTAGAFSGATRGAKSLGDQIAAMGNRMQSAGYVWSLVAKLGIMIPAMATAIAVAGAGITAVWGAVATAIAAVNSALALVGVGAAAVYLGFDGIKQAASSLAPEIEKLKTATSGVFAKEMTPAFERLRVIFPTLTAGFTGLASEISKGADMMSRWAVETDKAGRFETIFKNVRSAISQVNPALVAIVDSMTRVMTLESGFKVLSGAVDQFATSFSRAVSETIANGSLDAAFKGLEGTLRSLTDGFVSLVKNGIEVFANAAPGVNRFLDSLTKFFNRFDWGRLGTAVGDVFDGLAKALDGVSDETIEAITKAFEDLGKVFQNPKFQQGISDLIEMLPGLIDLIGLLVESFGSDMSDIKTFIDFMGDLADRIQRAGDVIYESSKPIRDFFDWLTGGPLSDDELSFDPAQMQTSGLNFDGIMDSFQKVKDFFTGLPEFFSGVWDQISTGASEAWNGISETLGGLWSGLKQRATETWNGLGEFFSNLWTTISTGASEAWTGLGETLGGLWEGIKTRASETWTGFGEFFSQLWENIKTGATDAWTGLTETLSGIWEGIKTRAAEVWAGFTETMGQVWENIKTRAGEAWEAVKTVIGEKLEAAKTAVTEKLGAIRETASNVWTTIKTVASEAWEAVKNYVTEKLEAAKTAVSEKLSAMRESASNAWNNIKTSASDAWEAIKTTVGNAIDRVKESVRNGFNDAVAAVREFPGKARDALGNLGSTLVEAGKALMRGLLNGIKNAATEVYNYVSSIAGKIAALKGPIPYDRRVLIPNGQALMLGLQKGLAGGFSEIESDLKRYTTAFANLVFAAPQMEDWRSSLDDSDINAIQSISGSWDESISADDYGLAHELREGVRGALAEWGIEIDANGMAKMVNKSNARRQRRR